MTRKPESNFNNLMYSETDKSFVNALFKECKRKNYKIGNLSPEDKELITVKDLSTAIEQYKNSDDPNKTIKKYLGL